MQKSLSQKVVKRIEAIERMDVVNAAQFRYLTEMRSYRWLCKAWGVNNRTVAKILEYCGIPIRHGGEAIKTQWINNPERRREAGKCLAETNSNLARQGKHVRQGKNKENSELIRQVANQLKKKSSFFRPEVRDKALQASLASRKAHPERMSALRKPLTPAKMEVFKMLIDKHLEFTCNRLCGNFVADFYVPKLNLIIDCKGRSRFPLSYERHKELSQDNRTVVYCVNEFLLKGRLCNLDDYISKLNSISGNPTTRSEITVIFGACGDKPFGADTDKFIVL